MTITTTQIRATVVAEAVQRALRECVCLLVYEYKDFFHHTVWAVLTEDERRPQESQLLCTIHHEGRVESTLDELFQDPLPNTLRHLSVVTFPIGSVQFNNVTITIPATDPTKAYGILCKAFAGFEYKTDTFQTSGAAHELRNTKYKQPISTPFRLVRNPRSTMAAGILSSPGSQFGPCADLCHHSDCKSTRIIAETLCRFCANAIGFNRRFYNDNGYVHASCLEDAIEQERSSRT